MDNENKIPLISDEKIYNIIKKSEGPYDNFCGGFFDSKNNTYVLGVSLSTAKSKKKLGHSGSSVLDEINVFDKAEVNDIYLGEINVIYVSSFCGPNGILLGLDLYPPDDWSEFKLKELSNKSVSIYSIEPLLTATRKLLGTIDKKNYPIFPGSLVPCAGKSIQRPGPCEIYSALAIGIPENRENNACLLMEDVGVIKEDTSLDQILKNTVDSIIQIGMNQKINYQAIFTGTKSIVVDAGEIGSALVLVPYLSLPKKITNSN